MDYLYSALATVLAYLLGSLSFAVIVSRLMGLKDPRSYGSNNPGATNVLRSPLLSPLFWGICSRFFSNFKVAKGSPRRPVLCWALTGCWVWSCWPLG